MAAVAGLGWLREPSASTPDMNPSNGVERPIRPLPKRRLKARLSEEEADSIVYPPVPSSSSPPFDSSDPNQRAAEVNFVVPATPTLNISDGPSRQPGLPVAKDDHSEPESEDEHEDGSISRQRSNWSNAAISQSRSAAHYSAASSGDGYESFENTNNKKKRKIPQHQHGASGHFSDEQVVGMAMSPGAYQLDGAGPTEYPYPSSGSYQSGNNAIQSGPGQSSSDSTVTKAPRGKKSASTGALNASLSDTVRSTSMVPGTGAANKNAQATVPIVTRKTAPSKPSPGSQKQDNQSYDFTFERQSQSSNRLSQTPRPVGPTQLAQNNGAPRDVGLPNSQLANTVALNEQRAAASPTQPQAHPAAGQAPPAEQPPPPSRTEQYRVAAQDRRRSQRALNVRQLREKKDVTLCEFCEFKAIWLYTPRFLIRRYEERDLKRRQEIENRRRLLEKAKAKSRKTKKGGKGGKAAAASQQPPDPTQQPYDPAYDDGIAPEDAQSPGEEYFDDEEFEEQGVHQDDYGEDVYGNYPPRLEPIAHGDNSARGYHTGPPIAHGQA